MFDVLNRRRIRTWSSCTRNGLVELWLKYSSSCSFSNGEQISSALDAFNFVCLFVCLPPPSRTRSDPLHLHVILLLLLLLLLPAKLMMRLISGTFPVYSIVRCLQVKLRWRRRRRKHDHRRVVYKNCCCCFWFCLAPPTVINRQSAMRCDALH